MHIREMTVRNYRSLREVTITGLSNFVILYGENDTGKSNVLSLLEHIFRQKFIEETTEVGGEERRSRMPGGFWRGEIESFTDNFRGDGPVEFSIRLRFRRPEILALPLPQQFLDGLPQNASQDHLTIEGRLERVPPDRARMILARAEFNRKVFYEEGAEESKRYLPEFKLELGTALDVFSTIMLRMTDSFRLVPAARFLTSEKEFPRGETVQLAPDSFKNWLFALSIDRTREGTFRQISERFNEPPFRHGRVSIARIAEKEIEVLVEDARRLKLPIGRKGSGVQQILFMLGHITESRSPMIGVEELEINLSPRTQAAIFDTLFALVQSTESPLDQVFLTTHSPHIARRDEAERRVVWMEDGETKVGQPQATEVRDFFAFPLPELQTPRPRPRTASRAEAEKVRIRPRVAEKSKKSSTPES